MREGFSSLRDDLRRLQLFEKRSGPAQSLGGLEYVPDAYARVENRPVNASPQDGPCQAIGLLMRFFEAKAHPVEAI